MGIYFGGVEQTIWGGLLWDRLTEERLKDEKCLERYGYKVYSQNDEDGILQEILRRIGVTNKTFVEFGVQDGLESNCHYLLFQGWKGLWLEGSGAYVKEIQMRFRPVIQNGQLKVRNAFITRENINDLLLEEGMSGEIDLLSIDIDGNDWYVWKAITAVNPRVVIIEYNGKFPPDCDWKQAYAANHVWDGSDWQGASLKAMELLGRELGYQLVGTDIIGSNAFFVRKDLAKDLFFEPATAEALYNPLRKNIFHKCGHPARYCLKGQQENLGIFNYLSEGTAVASFGFHAEECGGDSQERRQWIGSLESEILFLPKGQVHCVKIPYFISGKALLAYKRPYAVMVSVNGGKSQKFSITVWNRKGELQIKVPVCPDSAALKIQITLPKLWIPCKVGKSDDKRELGLLIYFSGISAE